MNDPLAEALRHNWSVIPTRSDKKPAIGSWKEFQTHPPTPEQVNAWKQSRPAGWAVVTGSVSRVVVFDFDGTAGVQTLKRFGVKPHVRTGSGGAHWYTEHPGFSVTTLSGKSAKEFSRQFPALDIRADGGYCVFTGRNQRGSYKWLRPMEPDPWQGELINAMLPFIRKEEEPATRPAGGRAARKTSTELPQRLLRDALERVQNGHGRNETGFWLSCQCRDNSFSQSEAEAVLLQFVSLVPQRNTKGQRELYTPHEARASVESAYRAAPREAWSSGHINGVPPAAVPTRAAAATADTTSTAESQTKKERQKGNHHFLVTDGGVFYTEQETGLRIFVSSLLRVEADTRDSDSESWGRLLEWKDRNGREHKWAMPMALLAGDCTAVRETLLSGGVTIGTGQKARQLLTQYLQTESPGRSAVCVPSTGWHHGQYVFPDSCIGEADGESVIYQQAARGEHFYRVAGTFDEWRDRIGRPCVGNSRLAFAVSAAFAGPLIRPLNVEGGGFHVCGCSSSGKSTVQLAAGSVIGGGHGAHGFARSWRFTANAIEATAELHNDCLLILDEMREMDPKDIDQTIYMLSNGTGKSRLNKALSTQRTLQWQLLLLSSGEVRLSEYAAAAGGRIKGGAEVRLLNIPADAGSGMGIFEDLHGAESPRVFAEQLKAAASRTYGTALRAFLERLVRDRDSCFMQAQACMTAFMRRALPPGAAPEVGRAARRVAVVAAAGEMATAMGITGWEQGEAERAALRCFGDWLVERGGIGQADVETGIRQVRAFLETHGASRFQSVVSRDEERVPERAGFWRLDEDGKRVFLVFPETFRNQLCRGLDYRLIAQELQRRNLLIKGDGNNFARKERVPGEDLIRMYAIRARILDGDEDEQA